MSINQIKKITLSSRRNYPVHIESYNNAQEVAADCARRQRTDSSFTDMPNCKIGMNWHSVESYEQALDLMRTGYQPTVDAMRDVFKGKVAGESKRFTFQNSIQGFAPIVPLALKGVPNCMMDMQMKPIKAKVIDVYYDMVASCMTDAQDIIKAGQQLLGAVVELERQGYRFNLYAVQTYSDDRDCDMLVVKVKDSAQPLDLKRISFPLTHTGFFRVIGFDWYSKTPGGKYRRNYGHAVGYDLSEKETQDMVHQLFGKNAIYLSCAKVVKVNKDHIKEVLSNGNSKD